MNIARLLFRLLLGRRLPITSGTLEVSGVTRPVLILPTGVENLSWGPPVWTCRAQPPWTVQEGDLVQAELFRT